MRTFFATVAMVLGVALLAWTPAGAAPLAGLATNHTAQAAAPVAEPVHYRRYRHYRPYRAYVYKPYYSYRPYAYAYSYPRYGGIYFYGGRRGRH